MPDLDMLDAEFDLDFDLEDADFDLDNLPAKGKSADPLAEIEYSGDLEQDCAVEVSALKAGFIARAKSERLRKEKATDSEYWVCLCFQSRDQVEEFLRKTKWGRSSDKYLDGQKVAKKIGVELSPEQSGFGSVRIDSKLASLAME